MGIRDLASKPPTHFPPTDATLIKPLFPVSPVMCILHRWGNPEFGAYVVQLQQQADEALVQSPAHMDAARDIVAQVVRLEVDFWDMAYAGGPASQ